MTNPFTKIKNQAKLIKNIADEKQLITEGLSQLINGMDNVQEVCIQTQKNQVEIDEKLDKIIKQIEVLKNEIQNK